MKKNFFNYAYNSCKIKNWTLVQLNLQISTKKTKRLVQPVKILKTLFCVFINGYYDFILKKLKFQILKLKNEKPFKNVTFDTYFLMC